jgi:hypothetical protein
MSHRVAKLRVLAAVGASLMFLPSRASAYRPFDQTDADIAAPREIELELGPLAIARRREGNHLNPGFVFNLGLSRRFELVVEDGEVIPVGPRETAERWESAPALLVKGLVRRGSLSIRYLLQASITAGLVNAHVALGSGAEGVAVTGAASYFRCCASAHWTSPAL